MARQMHLGRMETHPLAGYTFFWTAGGTRVAKGPVYPNCAVSGSHLPLPPFRPGQRPEGKSRLTKVLSGLLPIQRTPFAACETFFHTAHCLASAGRGTLLTCGDVEENPGPKGGKKSGAQGARRQLIPPTPQAPATVNMALDEDDEEGLLHDAAVWSHASPGWPALENTDPSPPDVDTDVIGGLIEAGMPLEDINAMVPDLFAPLPERLEVRPLAGQNTEQMESAPAAPLHEPSAELGLLLQLCEAGMDLDGVVRLGGELTMVDVGHRAHRLHDNRELSRPSL